MKQLSLDLRRPAPVISLREYRRGWRAARALWGAGFNPWEQLPSTTMSDDDEFAFILGWRHFCKEIKHGR
jgi:hypothetical protein